MPVLILSKARPKIGAITLDLSLNEGHSVTNRITDHPVAGQADKSDHVQTDPRPLMLTGIITPLATNVHELVKANLSGDKHNRAWVQFREMAKRHDVVTVYTTLEVYTNMVIQNLRTDRIPGRENALFVAVSLRELQIADVAELSAIADDFTDLSSPGVDLGSQGASAIG